MAVIVLMAEGKYLSLFMRNISRTQVNQVIPQHLTKKTYCVWIYPIRLKKMVKFNEEFLYFSIKQV